MLKLDCTKPGSEYLSLVLDFFMALRLALLTVAASITASLGSSLDFSFSRLANHSVHGFGCMLWADQTFGIDELRNLNIKYIRIARDHTTVEQMQALRKVTDALDIRWIYVTWEAPKRYTSDANMLVDVEGFAAWWVQQVTDLDKEAVCPHYLDLMNEPDSKGNWSTGISPTNYNMLVKSTRRQLDRAGYQHVGIVGPGTAVMTNSPPFISALDEEAVSSLSAFAVHAYDDGVFCHGGASCIVPTWKKTFGEVVAGADSEKPVFVTEYATQWPVYHGVLYPSPDTTAGFSFSVSMGYAARVAQNTLALLNSGAAVPFYWEAEDERAGKDSGKNKSWGFVSRSGEHRPVYYALQQLFTRIPRGARVLMPPPPLPHDAEGIYAGVYATESSVIAAVANIANKSLETIVRIWEGGSLSVQEAAAVVAAERGNASKMQGDTAKVVSVPLSLDAFSGGSSFSVTLPADSVFTATLARRRTEFV